VLRHGGGSLEAISYLCLVSGHHSITWPICTLIHLLAIAVSCHISVLSIAFNCHRLVGYFTVLVGKPQSALSLILLGHERLSCQECLYCLFLVSEQINTSSCNVSPRFGPLGFIRSIEHQASRALLGFICSERFWRNSCGKYVMSSYDWFDDHILFAEDFKPDMVTRFNYRCFNIWCGLRSSTPFNHPPLCAFNVISKTR